MCPYSSTEWYTLPHVIITSDTDWYPSVLDYTEAEDYESFDTILDSSKSESRGLFDMHGDYVDHNIVQYIELWYFDAATYDEYYGLKIWKLC